MILCTYWRVSAGSLRRLAIQSCTRLGPALYAAAASPRLPNRSSRSVRSLAEAFKAESGSNGFSRPYEAATRGMNCAIPCAPAGLTTCGFETALLLNQICEKRNGQIIGCSDGSRCAAKLGLRQFPLVSPRRVRQRISVRLRFDFFQPRLDQRIFRRSSQNWRHDRVRAGRRRHAHSGGRSRTRQGNCLREIFRRNGIGRRCNAQCGAQKDQSHNKGSPGCKSSFPAFLSVTV